MLGLWETFYKAVEETSPDDLGIGITRSRWLLPLFQELGYGTLQRSKVTVIDGKEYPVSHFHGPAPIHLVGFGIGLDKRTAGAAGAARISPHGLLQEFLNRSDPHLWGFVSNGYRMRILRDSVSLTRQAYVEFDLKSMMEGEVYSDFVLLWMLCNQSRIETKEDETPDHCWLEKWSKAAQEQGTRALEDLRNGVENAITALGSGFLACRSNTDLRHKLQSGELDKQDYYRHLLRIVYRLIFLFTAEDRDLLLLPDADKQVKDLYTDYYSTQRLRKLAQKTSGTQHCDLYQSLCLVFEKLDREGCSELGLPALGSFLWSHQAIGDLAECDISNRDLLDCIRALAFTVRNHSLIAVDYKNIGSEELGSIYESLLELHPDISADAAAFELKTAGGHERKTTGSYYTPTSLINCLLDSALEPVIKEALGKPNPEKVILNLKVCDPACGSGHFLVAAAHRIAKRLAAVRTGDEEPSPEALRTALRDVIGHCVHGVDINPMSVELCKISLWLEAIEPGKPLSFLDHHIKCGNSLLGTTPALMAKGIPDDAFKPIEGDVKTVCNEFKRQNKDERRGQQVMLFDTEKAYAWDRLGDLTQLAANLDNLSDDDITSLEQKRVRYEQLVKSAGYEYGHLLADLWCAAFVIKKDEGLDYAITENIYRDVEENPHNIAPWLKAEVRQLADEYQLFHWYLEFPSVFQVPSDGQEPDNEHTGLCVGFDCVLGNPPWERIKLQEKEFFASLDPDIANAPTAARRRAIIAQLPEVNPSLFSLFQTAKRKADGDSHLVRNTGSYPFCGRGDINTYSIFAELNRNLISPYGRVGCIVPSGIATDDTTKYYFQDLSMARSLVSLYSFENEEFIFPQVHHATKFCLLTMSGKDHEHELTDFVFFARQVSDLNDAYRHFTLSSDDITLLNPNTRTCPIFRSKADAELTKHIYRQIPVFINDANHQAGNPWGVGFSTMFHMTNDSGLFHTREQLEEQGFRLQENCFRIDSDESSYLPLYEGKMFWHFDHRFGTYEGQTQAQANQGKLPELDDEQHSNPHLFSLPRYWVHEDEVRSRIPKWPELIASALELPEIWRQEAISKAFRFWVAGYYRQVGDDKRSDELLGKAMPISASDTAVDVINRWLTSEQCQKMQERFPLCQIDVETILNSGGDLEPLAKNFVKRFSPHWFMAFRDITSSVVLRTAVFSILPVTAVGNKAPLVFTEKQPHNNVCLLAALNSFVFDYTTRQSLGGSSMNYFILKQLPVPAPPHYGSIYRWLPQVSFKEWLLPRTIELVATSWDTISFLCDIGYDAYPFQWHSERRHKIRCELDAAFFHLYLATENEWKNSGTEELLRYFPTPRSAVDYIMETFPIVKRKDEQQYGSYRTKELILEIYDKMNESIQTGQPYKTILDPPPADPSVAHPPKGVE